MRHFALMSASAVVLALSSVAPAFAAESAGPAGSSAVDQYKESIPTDDGTRAPTDRQRRALAKSGRDGRQLAEILAAGDSTGSGTPAAALSGTADAAGSPASGGPRSDAADTGPRDRSDQPGQASEGDSGRSGGGEGPESEPAAEASERSPVKTTVSASLGAKVGPTQLWVALGVILVAGLGVAVVRRSA